MKAKQEIIHSRKREREHSNDKKNDPIYPRDLPAETRVIKKPKGTNLNDSFDRAASMILTMPRVSIATLIPPNLAASTMSVNPLIFYHFINKMVDPLKLKTLSFLAPKDILIFSVTGRNMLALSKNENLWNDAIKRSEVTAELLQWRLILLENTVSVGRREQYIGLQNELNTLRKSSDDGFNRLLMNCNEYHVRLILSEIGLINRIPGSAIYSTADIGSTPSEIARGFSKFMQIVSSKVDLVLKFMNAFPTLKQKYKTTIDLDKIVLLIGRLSNDVGENAIRQMLENTNIERYKHIFDIDDFVLVLRAYPELQLKILKNQVFYSQYIKASHLVEIKSDLKSQLDSWQATPEFLNTKENQLVKEFNELNSQNISCTNAQVFSFE